MNDIWSCDRPRTGPRHQRQVCLIASFAILDFLLPSSCFAFFITWNSLPSLPSQTDKEEISSFSLLSISLRRACHPFASVTSSLLRSSSVASSRGNCSNNHTNSLRKHKQPLLLSKVRLGHFSVLLACFLVPFSYPSLDARP